MNIPFSDTWKWWSPFSLEVQDLKRKTKQNTKTSVYCNKGTSERGQKEVKHLRLSCDLMSELCFQPTHTIIVTREMLLCNVFKKCNILNVMFLKLRHADFKYLLWCLLSCFANNSERFRIIVHVFQMNEWITKDTLKEKNIVLR